MSKKIRVTDLKIFDIAEHLNNPEDVADYMRSVIEDGDEEELAHAQDVAIRAESRFKAKTVRRECNALLVRDSATSLRSI